MTGVELGKPRRLEDVSKAAVNIGESGKAALQQMTSEQRFT